MVFPDIVISNSSKNLIKIVKIWRKIYIILGVYPFMDQHELLEILRNSGAYVFTPRVVSRIAGIDIKSAYVAIHRFLKKGKIYPVSKGRFSITDDPFVISTQLISPSYLSFSTAMYLHARLQQVINEIYVVTPKKKSSLKVMGMNINFVIFKPYRVFGYRKVKKGNSYVLLADIEKMVVDSLYLPRYTVFENIISTLHEGFDKELLEKYTLRMESEAVLSRAGYLLETLGYRTSLSRRTKTVYRLNPAKREYGNFNNKWRLYVNEVI